MKSEEKNEMLEKEMIFSRIVDAPRELVFDSWTKLEHLEKWWGPDGFTTTTQKFDLKEGGEWIFIMHGPDGRDYPNKIIFEEVNKPLKLVYRHSDNDGALGIKFHVEVNFKESGKKTIITMHSVFEDAEMLKMVVRDYGAYEGAIQHLNKLINYVISIK